MNYIIDYFIKNTILDFNQPVTNTMINSIFLFDNSERDIKSSSQFGIIESIKDTYKVKKAFMEYCLLQCTDLKSEDLYFSKGKFGKPFLKKASGVHFNLSHKFGVYVFICSNQPVGIDIEKSNIDFVKPALKRFFSEKEWLQLHSSEQDKFNFDELWSLKESYSKYIGLGLLLPFSSFTISKMGNQYGVACNPKLHLSHLLYNTVFSISICSKAYIDPKLNVIFKSDLSKIHIPSTKRTASNSIECKNSWGNNGHYNINSKILSNEC